jgi:adenylate cyclase
MPEISEVRDLQDRRLVAILAADIAGYSRLMGLDEAATIADLKAHQTVVLPMVGQYGGKIIDLAARSAV